MYIPSNIFLDKIGSDMMTTSCARSRAPNTLDLRWKEKAAQHWLPSPQSAFEKLKREESGLHVQGFGVGSRLR